METMIVYVDDADYARKMLEPLVIPSSKLTPNQSTHWIVVASTPHVPNDITKWVSAKAFELWQEDRAMAMFDQVVPLLVRSGDTVKTLVTSPKQRLVTQTEALLKQHIGAKVLDARRPKFGHDMEPVTAAQPRDQNAFAGITTAVTLASVLAADF
jgi:hypothetical protein